MNGFQKEIYKKFQGIHADVIISSDNNVINVSTMENYLQTLKSVDSWSPTTVRYGMIATEGQETAPLVVVIKAIDPGKEIRVNDLHTKVDSPHSLTQLLKKEHIIIGKKLAEQIGAKENDTIQILFADQILQQKKPKFSSRDLTISAIFSIGIEELDANMIICSYELFNVLFPSAGVEQLNVKLAKNTEKEPVISQLQEKLPFKVYSWESMYLPLVAALQLEKYVTFFVLALITLIASMNIISLVFMQISQKRADIAILKVMGMKNRNICLVFLFISLLQSSIAAIAGMLSALGVGTLLTIFPFIELPEIYVVTRLPISMEWEIFALVFLTILAISFIAALIPVCSIRSIHISNVLRHEG